MTILPDVDYPLPKPKPTDSLTAPSHATLHADTATAIQGIDDRLEVLEGLAPTTALNIQQARLAAHTVMVRGLLLPSLSGTLLVPVIWNMTDRPVTFQAAKATLMTAADEDFEVDIVVGSTITDNLYNLGTQTSILKSGKRLLITPGQHVTATLVADDFVGTHPINTWLAVAIKAMGSDTAPGGDLTVQINRDL